jgi:hypothetical protein
MKTARIAKILAAAALASLGLTAGSSQADSWGPYTNVNAPGFDQPQRWPDRSPAFCPPRDGSAAIDQRQHRQMDRIVDGVRSGQLTRHEARDLVRDQRQIENLERRYLADGRLDRHEWVDLNRRLNQASGEIFDERHDYDRHGPHHGGWR